MHQNRSALAMEFMLAEVQNLTPLIGRGIFDTPGPESYPVSQSSSFFIQRKNRRCPVEMLQIVDAEYQWQDRVRVSDVILCRKERECPVVTHSVPPYEPDLSAVPTKLQREVWGLLTNSSAMPVAQVPNTIPILKAPILGFVSFRPIALVLNLKYTRCGNLGINTPPITSNFRIKIPRLTKEGEADGSSAFHDLCTPPFPKLRWDRRTNPTVMSQLFIRFCPKPLVDHL